MAAAVLVRCIRGGGGRLGSMSRQTIEIMNTVSTQDR